MCMYTYSYAASVCCSAVYRLPGYTAPCALCGWHRAVPCSSLLQYSMRHHTLYRCARVDALPYTTALPAPASRGRKPQRRVRVAPAVRNSIKHKVRLEVVPHLQSSATHTVQRWRSTVLHGLVGKSFGSRSVGKDVVLKVACASHSCGGSETFLESQ